MKQIHPEPAACWIWPRPTYNTQNAYAGFRHDFNLAALPSAAPLVITAMSTAGMSAADPCADIRKTGITT